MSPDGFLLFRPKPPRRRHLLWRFLFLFCSESPHSFPVMPDEPFPPVPIADLAAATPEEIVEAISYALRYDERGKPRKGGWDFAAGLAAERLVEHLRRSGFILFRTKPGRPHSAG
jgi:hypothetical protein